MNAEALELRHWFHEWMKTRPELTVAAVAAYCPISKSGAEAFLSRRAAEDVKAGEGLVYHMKKVKALIEAGDILRAVEERVVTPAEAPRRGRPSRANRRQHPYYQTSAASRVRQVLDYCAENGVIGVFTAEYGAGKTTAVRRWREEVKYPSCYFEFNELSRSSIKDFLIRLADLVGASSRQGGSYLLDAIIDRLADEPQLVIFDQCETVVPRVLQVMRQIWDGCQHAGTGMVILSAPLLRTRLETPHLKAEVGSLSSRVAVWASSDGVSAAEAQDILRQEGVREIDAAAVDLVIRMARGSMRRLMNITELLTAKHAGKKVTVTTIETAAGHLWGMSIDPRRRAVAA